MLKRIYSMILLIPFLVPSLMHGAVEHHGDVTFSGLPVPGVMITASQGEKKFVAVTDEEGFYSLPDLADGTWRFQVEMLGFSSIVRDIAIAGGAEGSKWELTMLSMTEIKPDIIRADISPRTEVTAAEDAQASDSTEPSSSGAFANVSPEELTERAAEGFLINGSVNNGAASPFAQLAAFGNNRSGGRSLYNGGVGITLDNSAVDARSFSLTGKDTPKPSYNYLQGAITFGGPLNIPRVVRNGPNLFFSYQRTQNRNATTQPGRMPSADERNGDLSQIAGIIVPQNQISPQARALLTLFPMPNVQDNGRYNYQVAVINVTHQDAIQLRLNKAINSKNQLSGNLDYQSSRTDNGNVFGFADSSRSANTNAALNFTHRFDPRFASTVRYQLNRSVTRVTPYFANRVNVSGDAGILGSNQEPLNWGPPGLTFFSGFTSISDVQHSFDRDQSNAASVTNFVNRGRHNLTFGGDFRRQQLNLFSQQDARGLFTFTGAATGFDFADFLRGIPDASSIAFGNADKYFRGSNYAAHFADDWRISAGFTLNAGLRWEYEAPMTEKYGRLVNLSIASDFVSATPVVGGSALRTDRSGFQPRLSLAWRPVAASSLVVRGGYGIYRNTAVYAPIVTQMAQQSPLSKSIRLENSVINPLTLANGFSASVAAVSNTFAVDPNFRVGYAQNWQVSVQRDLPASLQLVTTYSGAKGSRLAQKSLPNTFPGGTANSCNSCPAGFVYLSSNGNSIRHAGQVQLRRRLHNGFTANVQYTLSKSIDDAALGAAGQGGGPTAIAQNWLDLKAERALSNFDQRHLMSVQTQYTTGVGVVGGALLNGWKGALLKEWTVVTQMNVGSGMPLTPVYPAAVKGLTGSVRPDFTGVPAHANANGVHLNPAAYRAPAPGQWGNAGRNSIAGPTQFGFDASVGRTFRVGDRWNADFRLEATNVLNHVSFPSWNTTVTSTQFGSPDRANAMRKVQANLRLRF